VTEPSKQLQNQFLVINMVNPIEQSNSHPFSRDVELLVESKNASYGNSIGKSADILRTLCPDGIPVGVFHRAHVLIRMLDKICRLFSPTIKKHEADDAWRDIAGYAYKGLQLEEEYDE